MITQDGHTRATMDQVQWESLENIWWSMMASLHYPIFSSAQEVMRVRHETEE